MPLMNIVVEDRLKNYSPPGEDQGSSGQFRGKTRSTMGRWLKYPL